MSKIDLVRAAMVQAMKDKNKERKDALSMLLFKRKVPERYQAAMNTACFVLLMGLMLLVTLKDVTQLFQS